MSILRKILIELILAVVVFSLGFLSGCGTIGGAFADIEYGAGAAKKALKPFDPSLIGQQ